jgi:hypothetical protein
MAAVDAWRATIPKHRLSAVLVAAFVSTHIATVTGFWYRIIGLPNLDWPAFNGILLLPNATTNTQFWSGSIYHYMTGICYGIVFAYLIHPFLPFRNTIAGNIGKALIWGVVLATLSALLWVPRNFPALHPGFFAHNLGAKTVLGIYIWHLVYGLNLGALYSPPPEPEGAVQPGPTRPGVG